MLLEFMDSFYFNANMLIPQKQKKSDIHCIVFQENSEVVDR